MPGSRRVFWQRSNPEPASQNGKPSEKCSVRIALAPVQVVAVFDTNWADDRLPVKPCADGVERHIEGVVLNAARLSQRIGEQNERSFRGQRLLEFHAAEQITFSPHEPALLVSGRGAPFLITTNGILAARKEKPGEGQSIARTAQGDGRAVA